MSSIQQTFGKCLTVFVLLSCAVSVFGETPPKLTAEEASKWREDLQFIARELPAKHKNLFHRLNRDAFYNTVKEIDAKIPTLTRNQAALELERLVGLARDGHTWTSPLFDNKMGFHLFPLRLYVFEDGIFVRSASPAYQTLAGGKVRKIGNTPIDQAYQIVSPYMSVDNEMGVKNSAPRYLVIPEVLQALGITDSADSAVYEVEKGGKTITAEVKAGPNDLFANRHAPDATKGWVDANADATNPLPLTLKKPGERFWFEYVKETRLLFVQLNQVLNRDDKTLAQFFAEVFDFAGKNDIDKFVLDLRYNGGGNNTLIKPIIRGLIKLDKIDQPGHLFVITGRQTFSAAQNLTNELENWTNAVFVGEPTASHVNLYGDARRYELPNSKMPLFISELWWQNKHARDERKWTPPQLAAELTFADYAANIDPPMQAILAYKPVKPLREMALAAVQSGHIKQFLEEVAAVGKNPLYKYQITEGDINDFGYRLLQMNRPDDAIEVFKLNVGFYPESANVYDSLAEAYMVKGNKELAIKFYKKSLELDPANTGAKQNIEKMEKEKP
jgi:hypothetical protein